jgi:hypothetical protein
MNMRSNAGVMAAQAALTSWLHKLHNTPATFAIKLDEPFQLNRFNRLKNREIKSTKWVCPDIFNQLGLNHAFNSLCNNVGFLHSIFQEATTYRRLIHEFLSTVEHTLGRYYVPEEEHHEVDRVTLHLMNLEYGLGLYMSGATTLSLTIAPPPIAILVSL